MEKKKANIKSLKESWLDTTTQTGGNLIYSSSDNTVSAIDNTELITGVKEGTAIITA